MPLWPGPIPGPAVKRGSFLIFKQTAMSFPLQPLLHCAGLTPFTVGLQLLEHSGSSASMTQVDGEILLLSFGDTGVAPPVSLFLDSSIDAGLIVCDTAASDPITLLTEVEPATTGGGLGEARCREGRYSGSQEAGECCCCDAHPSACLPLNHGLSTLLGPFLGVSSQIPSPG